MAGTPKIMPCSTKGTSGGVTQAPRARLEKPMSTVHVSSRRFAADQPKPICSSPVAGMVTVPTAKLVKAAPKAASPSSSTE